MAADSTAKTSAAESAAKQDNGIAFSSVKDSSSRWQKMAFGVTIGPNYNNYRDALIHHMAALMADGEGDKAITQADIDAKVGEARSKVSEQAKVQPDYDVNGYKASNPLMFASPSVSDASVGGNDAINPYSAFNMDDDIVHDVTYAKGNSYGWGMGRCYAEMYESKQQILYLTMGVPKYRNLQKWLENATNREMSEMNDIGESKSLFKNVGKLLGGAISLAIQLPWLPLKWAANIISSVHDVSVTEYFYFRDNMVLYYRYVNSILSEIAVGMGLYGNDPTSENQASQNQQDSEKGHPNNGANIQNQQLEKYRQNLPTIMQEGPDIFKIMCRRAMRMQKGGRVTKSTDDMVQNINQYATKLSNFQAINDGPDKKNPEMEKSGVKQGLKNFWTGLKTGAMEGMNFLGFRIEKCEVANESFSNSTENSPLLNTLNNTVAEKRQKSLDAIGQGQGFMAKALAVHRNVSQTIQNVKDIVQGQKSPDATIAYLASGNGFFDLPKQWSGSAGMSRSLSFNMKLRARTGGDNVSIFQSLMIPLSCLLAAALPRAAGDSTYTSPFLVRAFCKGMFAVPAGIISTLSITRGSSEFGWSLSKLPTVIDVSFTIEDLSPILFLSIAAGKGAIAAFTQAFANNTKMHEYINTLVGIGAKERYYLMGQLKRRLKTAMLISKNTTFSATYRGYAMGDSSIIRSLAVLTPYSWVKNN